MRRNLPCTDVHHHRADNSKDCRGTERHKGLSGDRFGDVLEKSHSAFSEDACFAFFRVVPLDDAYSAERFGETAGDLGVDARALAKEGACDPKSFLQKPPKSDHDANGNGCHERADVNENDERNDSCENSTDEVYKSCPDEVADPLYVGHDAGDEGTGAVLIIEGDRQATDMLL